MRTAHLIMICIGCLADAVATAAPLEIEVSSAWGGWSRPGRVTEIELRLQSQTRVTAELTLTAGTQVIRSAMELMPGESARVAVPLPASKRIIAAIAAAGTQPQRREIGLSLSEAPLLAWVASPVPAPLGTGFHVIQFDVHALPDNAGAYGSIDALVIDRALIDAITESQVAALLAFIASCGRTVLIGDVPAAATLLRGAAGCGGRNFAEASSADAALISLNRILDSTEPEPPRAASLGASGEYALDAWYLAVAVLAAGTAAVALAAIFSSSLVVGILVPLLAAAGGLWLMQSRPADARLLVWAEARSGDRLAQYTGMQRVTSYRRGEVHVPVLALLQEPRPCDADEPSSWSWDARGRRYTSARFDGRLFAAVALCYSGSFPVTRDAAARLEAPGRIALYNPGAAAWPAGTLAWNGRLQPLPVVAPGASLALNDTSGRRPDNAAERQAIARTPVDGLAVLWPLDLKSVDAAPTDGQAWLLLRVGEYPGRVQR